MGLYPGLFNCSYIPTSYEVYLLQNYKNQLGPMLLGEILLSMLQGIMLLQYQNYWVHYAAEKIWTKWLVHLAFVLCGLKFAYTSFTTYDRFISHFGDWGYRRTNQYEIGTTLSTSLAAAPCQIIYIYRCWILSHNRFFLIPACIALLTSVAGSCVGTWGSVEITENLIQGFYVVVPAANVNLAAGLACDLSITIFTCYYLLANKSGFSRQTDTLVFRLIRLSIETAMGPTIVALVNLILSNRDFNNQWYLLPNLNLAHVYGVSLLYTVNARRHVRDGISQMIPSGSIGQSTDEANETNWMSLHRLPNPLTPGPDTLSSTPVRVIDIQTKSHHDDELNADSFEHDKVDEFHR
ncbi:hypothetical protein M422DRAFT_776333 [Sphaerobolus stellatus SS14]|nr:hypothetical protein M422DRAFT_776333 [Sphaerobolus stellatus SS14]